MSNEFPRVNELRGLVKNPTSPEAYFQNFEQTVSEEPLKKRQFLDLEHELQGLDSAAWEHLKKELVPLLQKKHPTRGWQALFDKWNHAKAYNYLTRAGYSAIRFIPESRVSGQRTPDLEANLADTKALCEVKTINISENEARRRTCGGVGKTEAELADGFYNKLAKDLQDAKKQMAIYSGETLTKK